VLLEGVIETLMLYGFPIVDVLERDLFNYDVGF